MFSAHKRTFNEENCAGVAQRLEVVLEMQKLTKQTNKKAKLPPKLLLGLWPNQPHSSTIPV